MLGSDTGSDTSEKDTTLILFSGTHILCLLGRILHCSTLPCFAYSQPRHPHSATPKQVWIDGIPQLEKPTFSPKPSTSQTIPKTPNFDAETKEAIKYEGLQPLTPKQKRKDVIFANVTSVWQKDNGVVSQIYAANAGESAFVLVKSGRIECVGPWETCVRRQSLDADIETIDLEGGSLSPGLVSFGAHLGLVEIEAEDSANDGVIYDMYSGKKVPKVIGGQEAVIHAVDGLSFGGRNMLYAFVFNSFA